MPSITETEWIEHQKFEANWWGDCCNTLIEEHKQVVYAKHMGIRTVEPKRDGKPWPVYDTRGKIVLDIGGGPVSMLLKSQPWVGHTVVDPCPYPKWVVERYAEHRISFVPMLAEEFFDSPIAVTGTKVYGEIWAYNVLQHVKDPEKIARGAAATGVPIRAFEWINFEVEPGHPHTLTEEKLNDWYGRRGEVRLLSRAECDFMGGLSEQVNFWCLGG